MTTQRDPQTRLVLSWLREDTHENADRVLLRTLDEVDTTPQRRSGWPAWRNFHMSKLAITAAAAATALVVAFVGYNLPPEPGIVGSGTPSPSPVLLARGDFVIRDWGRVEFEAIREGSSVTGRMEIGRGRGSWWPITVDFQCTWTTQDGLITIGGYTTGTNSLESSPSRVGAFAAIALKRESPVKAQIWTGSVPGAPIADCVAGLEGLVAYIHPDEVWLRDDVLGSVEFGP